MWSVSRKVVNKLDTKAQIGYKGNDACDNLKDLYAGFELSRVPLFTSDKGQTYHVIEVCFRNIRKKCSECVYDRQVNIAILGHVFIQRELRENTKRIVHTLSTQAAARVS